MSFTKDDSLCFMTQKSPRLVTSDLITSEQYYCESNEYRKIRKSVEESTDSYSRRTIVP